MNEAIPPSPLYSPGNKKAASVAALVSGDSTSTLSPPQCLVKPCSVILPRLWPSDRPRCLPSDHRHPCHCSQPIPFPSQRLGADKAHDSSLSDCQWRVTCPIRYLSHQEEEKPLLPPQAFTVTAACDRVVQERGGKKRSETLRASTLTLQARAGDKQ